MFALGYYVAEERVGGRGSSWGMWSGVIKNPFMFKYFYWDDSIYNF
jgi:hypothetical protein